MKVELHDIGPVKRMIKVEVLADAVEEARLQALDEIRKRARVPGFREGKVPDQILQQQFAREIQEETVDKIVRSTLPKAFEEAKIFPISKPEVTPGLWSGMGGFHYSVSFEILPAITLKSYKGLKLNKTEVEVHTEEVETELKRFQEAMTQLEPVSKETPLQEGHVATVDFKGLLEGKAFEGGEAKDFMIDYGTGSMLSDFETAIKGAKIDEERRVEFSYPADYFNKELAGKKARFDVKIKDIRKKNVPALDDDFAKDLGEFQTLEQVREDVKKRVGSAKENQEKNNLFQQIIKELVEKNKFEVPESLVLSEVRAMVEKLAHEFSRRGQKLEEDQIPELAKKLEPEAVERVRGFLILEEIAREGKFEATEEEVGNRLSAISRDLNRPLAEVKAFYEKNRLVGGIKTRILHEKALEFVLNQAKIKVVKLKKEKK